MNFFDTSALIKGYMEEPGTERVREIMRSDSAFVCSVLAVVEFSSMLARKVREGALTLADADRIRDTFRQDMLGATALPVPEAGSTLIAEAVRLCRAHTLRGADSIHLATAIVLAHEQSDDPLTFLSSDRRLLAAATHEGLTAVDPTP